ncbi:MAG TPA: TIGR03089 family protein [Propionibacteriaceae bacterium]|nr:TIGR03089 family protein [Propionibacteriaceae bacterium]
MTALVAALVRRARRDGARPLLTYYDLAEGSRTELSGRTFANWVDKTYHLLVDLEVEPGDVVAVPLATTHPGHWVTLAVVAGAWQAGAVVDPSPASDAVVSVVGPGSVGTDASGTVLACSLHPLGFGFSEALPPGVVDFTAEVRMRPDAHAEEPVDEGDPAWRDGTSVLSHADLAAVPPTSSRVLVRPSTPLATLTGAYLSPLFGDGSAVVVVGDDEDAVARIVREERVD